MLKGQQMVSARSKPTALAYSSLATYLRQFTDDDTVFAGKERSFSGNHAIF
jgi:hypothetical protein